MYGVYGSYQHPEGEVNLTKMEIEPRFSPRNDRFASLYKLHFRIDIQLTPTEDAAARDPDPTVERANRQALFKTKIDTLVNVYSQNYQSCGLLHNDGSQTRHYLSNGAPNNISGCRVLYRSWPKGEGDEYSTVRTAYVVLGALFDEADSGIYMYREQVRIFGTAGSSWQWVENPLQAPIQQPIHQFTRQRIVQYGAIVGTETWPLGNVPPPLFPQWEKGHRRFQEYEYPHWKGNQYRLYGYQWQYNMEAPAGQVAIPNIY